MSGLARYLNPWAFQRERQLQQRLAELRARDGDGCRRCRRPMRFDLPPGHDLGAKIEVVRSDPSGQARRLDDLGLCHGRCNAWGADHTDEVQERVRRKTEAALFARKRRRAA